MVISGLTGLCAHRPAIACMNVAIAAGGYWMSVEMKHFNEQPDPAPLETRPCFFCGRMMDIQYPTRQLICRKCDVLEACEPIIYAGTMAATCGNWQGEEVMYLDHTKVYAPTP